MKTRKRMNKKAMFFTILAITLLSLFVVSYTLYSFVKERRAINDRIETMNNFVSSIEKDLPRKLYIAGFRIIFLFEKRMADTGTYITNLNSTFEEAFFDGTIAGHTNLEIEQLMQKATFSGIEDSLNEKAAKVNVDISLSNPNISISQEDPWNIKVQLKTDLLIKDKGNLALWNRTAIIDSYIPIENFEDPLFIIETNGLVTSKINQTPFSVPVPAANLLNHTQNPYYIASPLGPSFLDRLSGIKTANVNGIESLVDRSNPNIQGVDKSLVDYIYFSTSSPGSCPISGMPSWFRLDADHRGAYYVASC